MDSTIVKASVDPAAELFPGRRILGHSHGNGSHAIPYVWLYCLYSSAERVSADTRRMCRTIDPRLTIS
jgi:hypothetical protein